MSGCLINELVAFLRSRLSEDERVARWIIEHGCWAGIYVESANRQEAEHIARHDPARVIREVEAKRAILNLATNEPLWEMSSDEEYAGFESAIVRVLRLLAFSYADHPDYNEEWKPQPL